jgi:hypothetical protein
LNTVYVNGDGTGGVTASPYTAKPGDFVLVGTNHGNVTINLPLLSLNQSVEIKQDENTSYVSGTISVVAPAATTIAQPPPNQATQSAAAGTVVLPGGAVSAGIDLTWINGGSPGGGYVLK